jgi:UPF0271 protein
VDLNADLGEGFGIWRLGDDEALLDVITSANVACGFHAGDPGTMRRICAMAAARDVAIGAQVSYRDLAGFGRRRIDYDFGELRDDILYQLAALDGLARVAGARVSYLKPHGALYNVAAVDAVQAEAVVAAVAEYDFALPILTLPDSELARQATRVGLRVIPEGFADRAYTAAGQLVPRSVPGAVLTSVDEIAARAVAMAHGSITAIDGAVVPVPVMSICVHGDTPGAVAIARAVRVALSSADIVVGRVV